MERIGLLALLRSWVGRLFRRRVGPILPPRLRLEREDGSVPEFPPTLADMLRERLNRVTPWYVNVDVFTTRARGVAYTIRTPWLSSQKGEERGGTLETYLWNILSAVQSFMAHRSRSAWPSPARLEWPSAGPPLSRTDAERRAVEHFRQLPQPGVAIRDDRIRLWYGDPASPVLELDPLVLPPATQDP